MPHTYASHAHPTYLQHRKHRGREAPEARGVQVEEEARAHDGIDGQDDKEHNEGVGHRDQGAAQTLSQVTICTTDLQSIFTTDLQSICT